MVTSPARTQGFNRFEPSHRRQHTSSSDVSFASLPLALPKTPLFGTDGIRGRVGELLNADLALQVGFFAGQVLQEEAPKPGPSDFGTGLAKLKRYVGNGS
jgi:phosphoglucosamine mutase